MKVGLLVPAGPLAQLTHDGIHLFELAVTRAGAGVHAWNVHDRLQ